jgi:serine/threonine protein phosphatase PrpC
MSALGKLDVDQDTLELSYPDWSFSPKVSPASALIQVEIAAASHQGHVRDNNEDHYLAVRFKRSLETLFTNVEEGIIERRFDEVGYSLLVADGMGGMVAGEVASRMALCKLVELVVNTPDWIMKWDETEDAAQVMQRLRKRFRQVDDVLREQAEADKTLLGMGTTLTVAISLGADLLIGHIGDSRAYLLRSGKLHQLTNDHTLAQAMIDAGVANPQDSSTRAMRHVLTAALGSSGTRSDPQVQRLALSTEDQVLLCSDGLTEMVSDENIASVLNTAKSSAEACRSLIDMALSAGGLDNVTVVLARYHFPS